MTEEVKTEADRREQQIERIARQVNQGYRKDGVAVEPEPDEAPVEAKPEPAPEPVAEAAPVEAPVETAPETPAEPAWLSELVTRKVNGVDVTKPAKEWIADGQKNSAADRYLADASKAFKSAQPAGEPSPKAAPQTPPVEDDDRALARALQTGTEEEAAAVLARLRKQPQAHAPEQLLPVVGPLVQQQIAAFEAARQFQTEFKDVVSDPYLFQLAQAEDNKLLQAGFQGSNLDRFRAAGTAVRKWRESLAGSAQVEKQQRKASVTVLPTASGRAPVKQEEPEESTADVIAAMAKQRRGR